MQTGRNTSAADRREVHGELLVRGAVVRSSGLVDTTLGVCCVESGSIIGVGTEVVEETTDGLERGMSSRLNRDDGRAGAQGLDLVQVEVQ